MKYYINIQFWKVIQVKNIIKKKNNIKIYFYINYIYIY